MTILITRSGNTQRLRLVDTDEARAAGTNDAQQLLAEVFPDDENRTPADALYTALVEFIALADLNRFEELNERLKGFCEVVGPVLYQPRALEAKCALLSASLNQAEAELVEKTQRLDAACRLAETISEFDKALSEAEALGIKFTETEGGEL